MRRLLRDREAAEDAAQEALVRAWRQRATLRSDKARAVWLRRIARHEALRLLERSGRSKTESLDRAEEEVAGREDDFADRLDGELNFELQVGRLSLEDRRLVRLRYQLDLSQGEIAAVLGLNEATVRVRLHRIRHRMRRFDWS